jgi:ABC-type polysaccharide/polyol phosphate transport system ATPase subunit
MLSESPLRSTAETAVMLRGVTKTFAIWSDPSARLFAPVRRWFGANREESRSFTAVHDVTLEIPRGECLGIIGRNGAGKSTLLQMIAGTLQPTSGEITVRGRVAALLELGSGFNPDFTGRENIHLNAAILGLTPVEIAKKFDSIVDYSGIAEFIDQPVRTYSSGMAVRLAFAVCVHVDADILIIDEALAVGDARFQFKCHATLDQMIKEGRTIIFVSHDTNAVKRMCRSALLLERGEVLLHGSPNDVTNIYTKLITSPHGLEAIRGDLEALRQHGPAPAAEPSVASTEAIEVPDVVTSSSDSSSQLLSEERSHQQVSDKEYSYGGELGKIETVTVTDGHNQPRLSFVVGDTVRVHATCRASSDILEPIYALTLKDVRGQEIYGTNTYFQNQNPPPLSAGAAAEATFEIKLNVLPGVYFLSLGWVRLVNGEVIVVHRRYDVIRFDVLPRDKSFGVAYCPTTISVRPLSR